MGRGGSDHRGDDADDPDHGDHRADRPEAPIRGRRMAATFAQGHACALFRALYMTRPFQPDAG
jgi:hypothetical protein